jgi:hypothetical protein
LRLKILFSNVSDLAIPTYQPIYANVKILLSVKKKENTEIVHIRYSLSALQFVEVILGFQ